MKISQAKNYRKPLYAIGLSAVIMAAAVTGCTPIGYAGGEQIVSQETEESKPCETSEEIVEICGMEEIIEPAETD